MFEILGGYKYETLKKVTVMISPVSKNGYVRLILYTLSVTVVVLLQGCVAIRNLKECCRKKPAPASIVAPPRTVTVSGIVLNPGTYELPEVAGMTLQKAIAEAGGFMPSGIAYGAVEGFPDAVRFHEEHISKLALTLQREEITYVIPCPMVNTTELGVIRLRDRDVLTVMTLEAAGFDYGRFPKDSALSKPALEFEDSNPEKTVRFLGATLLNGEEVELNEVKALLGLTKDEVIKGSTLGLFGHVSDQNGGKLIDWSRNPQIARVTRRVSGDGRPRIFYVPLKRQFFNISQSNPGGNTCGASPKKQNNPSGARLVSRKPAVPAR